MADPDCKQELIRNQPQVQIQAGLAQELQHLHHGAQHLNLLQPPSVGCRASLFHAKSSTHGESFIRLHLAYDSQAQTRRLIHPDAPPSPP